MELIVGLLSAFFAFALWLVALKSEVLQDESLNPKVSILRNWILWIGGIGFVFSISGVVLEYFSGEKLEKNIEVIIDGVGDVKGTIKSLEGLNAILLELKDSTESSITERRSALKVYESVTEQLAEMNTYGKIKIEEGAPNLNFSDVYWRTNDSVSYYINGHFINFGQREAINFKYCSAVVFLNEKGNISDHVILDSELSDHSEIPPGAKYEFYIKEARSKYSISDKPQNALVMVYSYRDRITGKLYEKEAIYYYLVTFNAADHWMEPDKLISYRIWNYLRRSNIDLWELLRSQYKI